MTPALMAWIDFCRGANGRKVFSSVKVTPRSIDFARPLMPPHPSAKPPKQGDDAEGDWWENCMRDSFGSYRAAITDHIGKVALEMGNSETMVKRCYFDRKAEKSDGASWFTTGPAGWIPPDPAIPD